MVIVKYLFMLIGIGALWFSFSHIGSTLKANNNAIKVSGVVIALSEVNSNNGVTYAPVVEYTTQNSEHKFQFKSSSSANPPSYDVGERVDVAYSPDAPQSGYIDTWFARWATVLISGLIGVAFVLFSLLAFKFGHNMNTEINFSFSSGD